jgi:hypothetical protein
VYKSDGSLKSKEIYKYDPQGNRTEDAWYDSDGSLISKDIRKYDSQGNMTEMIRYDEEMKPEMQDVYTIIYRK